MRIGHLGWDALSSLPESSNMSFATLNLAPRKALYARTGRVRDADEGPTYGDWLRANAEAVGYLKAEQSLIAAE